MGAAEAVFAGGGQVVIPLFRSYRKNQKNLSNITLSSGGCNPFIQVLSEKSKTALAFKTRRERCNPFIQVLSEK